jgi:hypothetical protein
MLRRMALAVAGAIGLAGVSVSPVLAASVPATPYTKGELVQFQGQAAIYQVRSTASGLVLGWIPTSASFQAAGFQWSQVHRLPNGIPRPSDKEWLALNTFGGRGAISSPLPWDTGVVSSSAYIPITESLPSSGLIRYPGHSAIYVITKEPLGKDFRIRWIPSAAIFNAAGYSWSQVKTVPSGWLVKPGAPMTLLRVTGTTKVYALLNGLLHWIPSGQDFTGWGYNWQSVQTVRYLPYPVGAPLTSLPY